MQPAKTLLLATGALLLAGCSLLISEQLDEKGIPGGSGGSGGAGGAQATSSTASTTASVTTSTSAAGSAGASSGSCGSGCTLANATSACVNGACTISACDGHFEDCDKAAENGCEVNLNDDAGHCDSCDHACSAKDKCAGGKCK